MKMEISYTYWPEFKGLENYVDVLEFNEFPLDEKNLNLKRWLVIPFQERY